MVIAVLLQESPLFSTCWYFKSNRILSHCLILFQLCPSTDHIQEYVGAVNISIPTGGENPPIKEAQKGKNPSAIREPTQTEERANLEHPDKEIKETTPLNLIEFLPYKFTLQRQLTKQNIRKHSNKQKESTKIGRQKKNMQSKGMDDSPLREQNEMEASKTIGYRIQNSGYKDAQGTHR